MTVEKLIGEGARRHGTAKRGESASLVWLQNQLGDCAGPLLTQSWIFGVDSTFKPLPPA